MAKKEFDENEGYQYQEDSPETTVQAEEAGETFSAGTRKKGLARFKNRKMIIIILVIIVIIVLISFMNGGSSSRSSTTMPSISNTTTVPPMVPDAILPVAKKQKTMPAMKDNKSDISAAPLLPSAPVMQNSIPHDELNTIANNIATDVSGRLTKQMNDFSMTYTTRLNDVSHGNAQLQSELAKLRDQLRQLTTQLNAQRQQIEQLKSNQVVLANSQGYSFNASGEMKSATTVSNTTTASVASVRYTVEAVMPGRAWLRVNDGSVITVSVGDVVPGLGDVTAIDAINGSVSTRSGAVITAGVSS